MATGIRGPMLWAIFGGWALALSLFAAWAMGRQGDPFCAALDDSFAASCTPELPPAAAYAPGTLIDRTGKVVGTLRSHCLLPGGANAWPFPSDEAVATPLAVANYTRLVGAGLAAVPAPPGTLSAIARDSASHDLQLHTSALRRQRLGNGNACLVQEACAERLASGDWRLIGETLSASVDYTVLRDDGTRRSIDLPGARVIGAKALEDAALAALLDCPTSVSRTANGKATAYVGSRGRRGAFAPERTTKGLGVVALATGSGAEVSDCDPNVGRERSRAYAQSLIALEPDGALRLSGEVRASSGRYRFGRCLRPGRRLPTNNTLVNHATAGVTVSGELALALRRTGPQRVEVRWDALPDGTSLRIDGPSGAALWQRQTLPSDGAETLTLTGPGVFLVRPELAIELRREGESGVISRSFDGTIAARTENLDDPT